uniref:C-type lectin domain-containing protein n=1 Tax=Onchocerca volvulus TaxID=6282 RepID=A0A8R1XXM5_ONCVO
MNNCRALTFIICFTAALCRVCDEGWRYSPHSRKCYKLFTRPMTWTEAEFHCRMQRSNQLSIHNSRENRFFKEIARDASEIWLGSANFSELIGYEWSDKTSYNFRGWKNGREPVTKSTQPCTKMNVTNGEWFQSCCRKPAPYICQKNPQNVNYASNKQNDEMIAKNSGFEQLRFLLRK